MGVNEGSPSYFLAPGVPPINAKLAVSVVKESHGLDEVRECKPRAPRCFQINKTSGVPIGVGRGMSGTMSF